MNMRMLVLVETHSAHSLTYNAIYAMHRVHGFFLYFVLCHSHTQPDCEFSVSVETGGQSEVDHTIPSTHSVKVQRCMAVQCALDVHVHVHIHISTHVAHYMCVHCHCSLHLLLCQCTGCRIGFGV